MTEPLSSTVVLEAGRTNLRPHANSVDRAAFGVFFAAVAMPFSQVVAVPLGIVASSGFEFVYILVTCLLCIKILFAAEVKRSWFPFVFFAVVLAYLIASVAFGNATAFDSIQQLRFYYPLCLAVFWITVGTNADLRAFFSYTAIATIISSTSALLLNYALPSYMEALFANSADATHVFEAGRMYWTNGPVVFVMLLYLSIRDDDCRIHPCLAGAALVLGLTAMFNTLNRTMLLGVAILVVGSVFMSDDFKEFLRRSKALILVVAALAVVATIIMSVDNRVRELFVLRFMGGTGGASQIYTIDFVLGRIGLYQQYWTSIVKYFPWGQGFGHPYSVLLGRETPITDVSLLSMLLPMGLSGVLLFIGFVWKLWRLAAQRIENKNGLSLRAIKLLLIASLVVSLNIDVFTRNNFVVLLSLFILCVRNSWSVEALGVPA